MYGCSNGFTKCTDLSITKNLGGKDTKEYDELNRMFRVILGFE